MLKIIQVIDALKVGGAEQLLITFAKAVQGQDVSLTVLTFRVQAPHMQAELEALGAQVVVIKGQTLLDPRRLWQLYRFIRQTRPDVIHAHLTTAIILATWVGRRCGVPVVCTLHNTQLKSKNRGRVWLHRQALRHWACRVLAVGHTVEAEFAADLGQDHFARSDAEGAGDRRQLDDRLGSEAGIDLDPLEPIVPVRDVVDPADVDPRA